MFASSFARLAALAIMASAPAAVSAAGKRGLAWPYYNSNNAALQPNTIGQGQITWIYNWETYGVDNAQNYNYIGTQRCIDCDSSPIAQLAGRAASWNTIFSLNEPDINGISASDAAAWYKTYINPLSVKKALPSITSSTDSGKGMSWLDSFISACGEDCSYDYINLHWYGPSFSAFQSYVESAHGRYPQATFVITEFALTAGSATDQANFLNQAKTYLDGLDYVALYSFFVATAPGVEGQNGGTASTDAPNSALFNDDGSLSAVGNTYKS